LQLFLVFAKIFLFTHPLFTMNKILLLLFLICDLIHAQSHHVLPISSSVADASVSENRYYSAFQNPAAGGSVEQLDFQFSYENKFLLKELSVKSIGVLVPTKLINIAAVASYTGYSQYNEVLAGVALSRNFGSVFQLGVQANYYSVYFVEVNKRYAVFIPQFGLQVNLSPAVTLGFSTFNPSQILLKTASLPKILPSVFSFGTKWKMTDDFNMLVQFDKNMSSGYRIAGGFEYLLKDFVIFKTGVYKAEYLVPSLGFGFKLSGLQMDLTAYLHPVLGLNSRALVRYTFQKK